VVSSHGFHVRHFDCAKALPEEPELAFAASQVQERLDEIPSEHTVGALTSFDRAVIDNHSVGSEINLLADAANADALVFLHYQGLRRSAGLRAKDAAAAMLSAVLIGSYVVPVPEYGVLQMAFVDGESGEVLWANANARQVAGTRGVGVADKRSVPGRNRLQGLQIRG
jgi:hypothetical protein